MLFNNSVSYELNICDSYLSRIAFSYAAKDNEACGEKERKLKMGEVMKINHINLTVNDVTASRDF